MRALISTCALALLVLCLSVPSALAKDTFEDLPKMLDLFLKSDDITDVSKILDIADLAEDSVKISPKTVRDVAKVTRKHAERWADDTAAPEGADLVIESVRKLTDTIMKKHEDDPDAQLAGAHTFVAEALVQIANGEDDDCPATFGKAAKSFAKVAELKSSKKAYYLTEAAETLRIGAKYAGTKLPMLDEASAYLKQAKEADPDSVTVLAEMGQNFAARATIMIHGGKKGDAKKVLEQGMAMLAPEEGAKPHKKTWGAYNELVDIATESKLIKKLDYATKTSSGGGNFKYSYPYGVGWKSQGAGELPGDGIFSLRRQDGKKSMRVGVSSYDYRMLYSDTGGDNPKGILRLIQELWERSIEKARVKGATKSPLPRWVKKANGFAITGFGEDSMPVKTWCWTLRSGEGRMLTYAIIVEIVGDSPKKMPAQPLAILKSITENKK